MVCASSAWSADFGDLRNLENSNTNSHFTAHNYRTLAEWQARRAQLRRQLLVSAGLWPLPEKTPLSARRFDRRDYGSYAIEKVVIETFPGFFLAGNLYLPTRVQGRAPGILVAHGHWKNGRVHDSEDYSVPALGVNLAAQGYVAFAYDMLGYNDTQQLKHSFGDDAEEQLWSFGPLGIQLWNSIRALDFLEAVPEVDPQRLAITGASGGGTQTFLLAGVDPRIQAAAPVDMVSASFQGDDACEMAPGLRVGTDNVEIAALMAPRPLLLVSSTRDWTKNTPVEEYPEIRAIYRLYRREDAVSNGHIDAPHNYNRQSREVVYRFFRRVFMSADDVSAAPPLETETFRGKLEDLLIRDQVRPGQTLANYKQLFQSWRDNVEKQIMALTPSAARVLLRDTLHVRYPVRVDTLTVEEQLLLERQGSGERVPARWIPGSSGAVAIVVHGHGSTAALSWEETKKLRGEGMSLLLLDVYQVGAAASVRPPVRGDHLVFHLSDDAERIQDILSALAWLNAGSSRARPVLLVCDKNAGLWCWAAAAVAGPNVRVAGPAVDLTNAERDLPKLLFVPGIQRAGGLPLIESLVAQAKPDSRPVEDEKPSIPVTP